MKFKNNFCNLKNIYVYNTYAYTVEKKVLKNSKFEIERGKKTINKASLLV